MRARSLSAVVACAVLGVSACSGEEQAAVTPSPTQTSAAPTPTPTPDVVVSGADAGLTAVVETVYAGQTGVQAKATVGVWGKEKVAVVTSGEDVTLAVGPTWTVVGGWWPSLDKPTPQVGKGPRFVLVIGSDARPGKSLKGTRGDTLQVLGIDGKGGGGVLGIARDVWAPMPGGGKAKINAAFAYGGGAGQVETVRTVTGLPIDGYVATGFSGFRKIVDGSGGLPMDVATRLVFLGKRTIDAGKQTLTGKQALDYARERKSLPDGDFGRSAHQSELLLAAAVKARLAGVGSVPASMTLVSENAESDLSAEDALTFVAAFYTVDPRKVGHAVAKGGFGTSSDGQSIVVLDGASKKAFKSFRDGRL